jgi:hypothetical protein
MDSLVSAGYEKAAFKILLKRNSCNHIFLAPGGIHCLPGLSKNQTLISQLNIN